MILQRTCSRHRQHGVWLGSALGSCVVTVSEAIICLLVFASEGFIGSCVETFAGTLQSSLASDAHGLVGLKCFKSLQSRETTKLAGTANDSIQIQATHIRNPGPLKPKSQQNK